MRLDLHRRHGPSRVAMWPRFALLTVLFAVGVAVLAPTAARGQEDLATEPRLAAQLYTVREVGAFAEQVRLVAEVGYGAVETFTRPDRPASEARALLDAYGLDWPSAHVPIWSLRDDLDATIDYYGEAGVETLVMAWLAPELRPATAEGWRELGRELAGYGAEIRAAGMRLAYHNHDFEMAEVDGRPALDHLLEAAGPDDLAWQADVAWIVRGGRDPAELLRRYAGRVVSIHAKDVAAPGTYPDQRGFADVGRGVLDWDAVLPAARAAGAQWFIVEHDFPGDAERALANAHAFLQNR